MTRLGHTRRAGAAGRQPRSSVGAVHQRGAALVEMALVAGLLAMFLFGIITFGIVLSFEQSLTQASNEAARAAAVAPRATSDDATPVTRARAAADRVASGWDAECNRDGLECSFVVEPCSNGGPTPTECMTVTLAYDLDGHPRTPTIPIVSSFLPSELVATVVVEVNPVEGP